MAIRQYIGARYVPKLVGEWEADTFYEALSIVTRNNVSFTSKKPVPHTVGEPALNPEYWVATGNYSAQMQEIVERLTELSNTAVKYFDTLADINNVNVGDYVVTLGYYTKSDKGSAVYYISDSEIEGLHSELLAGGKYAILKVNDYVLPEQLGAYGDNVHDDTTAIQNAIELANNMKISVMLSGSTYKVSGLISIGSGTLDCNNSTLAGACEVNVDRGYLTNGIIDGGLITVEHNSNVSYMTIKNFTEAALTLNAGCYETSIDTIRFECDSNSVATRGVVINSSDCSLTNIFGYGAYKGIEVNGANNVITNAHLWINSHNTFEGSTFIYMNATGNTFLACCCDSYQKCVDNKVTGLTNHYELTWINNNVLFHNKTFIPFNRMLASGYCNFRLTGMDNNNNIVQCDNTYGLKIKTQDGELSSYYKHKLNLTDITGAAADSVTGTIESNEDKFIISCTIGFTHATTISGELVVDLTKMMNITNNVFHNWVQRGCQVYLSGSGNRVSSAYYTIKDDGKMYIDTFGQSIYSIMVDDTILL